MKPLTPDQLPTALARHLFEVLRYRERLYVRLKSAAEADPALERFRHIALAGLEDARHQLALALLATAPGAPHAARRFGRYLAVASEDALGFGRPILRVLLLPAFAEELIRAGAVEDITPRPTHPAEAAPEGGE